MAKPDLTHPDENLPTEPGDSSLAGFTEFFLLLLKRRGISMADFAESLGVSYSALSNWKNGRSEPDSLFLLRTLLTNERAGAQEFALTSLILIAPEIFSPPERFLAQFDIVLTRLRSGEEPEPPFIGIVEGLMKPRSLVANGEVEPDDSAPFEED